MTKEQQYREALEKILSGYCHHDAKDHFECIKLIAREALDEQEECACACPGIIDRIHQPHCPCKPQPSEKKCEKCGATQTKSEDAFGCWSCGGSMEPKQSRIEEIRKENVLQVSNGSILPETLDIKFLLSELDRYRGALLEIEELDNDVKIASFEHVKRTVQTLKEIARKALKEGGE